MTKQTFLDYAETKKGSILLSSVSVSNNILSAINATDTVADNEKMSETERAITLAVFDVIGIVGTFLGESKIGKGLNVVSWGAEAGLVGHRLFFKNLPDYNAHRDFNSDIYKAHKGYIPLTLIYDIIADTAKLAEKLSDMARVLAKIPTTPASIILNVASALITQVSASLAIKTNNVEIKPEYLEEYKNADDAGREIIRQKLAGLMVHKDDFSFAEALGKAMIHVLTNKEALFGVLEQIIHQSIPDILNPFDKPREDELIGTLGDDVIDANSFFDDPYMMMGHDGNDTLIGGSRDDHLDGGNGNDVLKGNGGNDEMRGEQGYDTYHIKDHDTIYDADGKGQIIFDGKLLLKDFIKRDDSASMWDAKDKQGNVLYTARKIDNDLRITANDIEGLANIHDSLIIENFFTTATITGDNNSVYSALSIVLADTQADADKHGTFIIKTDETLPSNIYTGGVPSTYVEVIGSDKVDNIFGGSTKKQHDIDAGGGNDFIMGGDLGDTIRAGDGDDIVYASSGFYDFEPENSTRLPKPQTDKNGNLIGVDKDLIIGGAGNDLIAAGIGDDIIWVDDDYQVSKTLSADKDPKNPNNTHNNEKGDWAVGGRGNDTIHGGTNKDFLQGGADSDIIYGGGGDDVILGDGHIRFWQRQKIIYSGDTIVYDSSVVGNDIHPLVSGVQGSRPMVVLGQTLAMEYLFDSGKYSEKKLQTTTYREEHNFDWRVDIDYAQGDYRLTPQKDVALTYDFHILEDKYKDNTNDFLYGGKGDDLIIGQYGNDYLDGGEGNDTLWGDDNRDKDNKNIPSDDTLKGGAGKDTLIGGIGQDTYVFDLDDLKRSGGDDKVIIDSDNSGIIKINNYNLTDTMFFRVANTSNVYQTQDGKYELVRYESGNYALSSTEFNAVINIKDTPVQNGTVLGMILSHELKNTAPAPNQVPKDQTLLAGQDVIINLGNAFLDAEDSEDKLIYSLQGINGTGLHFDPATKQLTGKAPEKGTFNLTLGVQDTQGATNTTNFTLRINERPLVLSNLVLPAILTQNTSINTINLEPLFRDNDGDTLSYQLATTSTQGITLNGSQLIIDPSLAPIGTHTITITALDTSGQSVSTTTTFTISTSTTLAPVSKIVVPSEFDLFYDPKLIGKHFIGTLMGDALTGDDKTNIIKGLRGNDTLVGLKGNDKLDGGDGNDTLMGGKDNDMLIGGLGHDTYLYHKGDGFDVIKDEGGNDTLKITGLTLSELGFIKQDNHLFIHTNPKDNTQNTGVFVENYFHAHTNGSLLSSSKTGVIEQLYINDKAIGYDEVIKMVGGII